MLIKRIKKIVALALTIITISIPLGNSVHAMEPGKESIKFEQTFNYNNKEVKANIEILKDDTKERVAKVILDNTVSISTYNKETGETSVKETNLNTNEKTNHKFELDSEAEQENISLSTRRSNSSKWGKVAYSISGKSWKITNSKKKSKSRTEKSSNKDDLMGFKSSVDSCRRAENTAVSLVGTSLVAGYLSSAGLPALGTIIAALVAVGAAIAAAPYIYDALQSRKDADWYYSRIS